MLREFVYDQGIDEIRVMISPDYADVDDDQDTSEILSFYYHTDWIGSVVAVTGPDETVVEQYEYTPYGVTTIKDGQGNDLYGFSAIGNPFMFTARRLDEETGLYHYRHRAYDPAAGRFLQRDPLGYVDGPNALEYCRSQPTELTDPMGEDPDGNPRGERNGKPDGSRHGEKPEPVDNDPSVMGKRPTAIDPQADPGHEAEGVRESTRGRGGHEGQGERGGKAAQKDRLNDQEEAEKASNKENDTRAVMNKVILVTSAEGLRNAIRAGLFRGFGARIEPRALIPKGLFRGIKPKPRARPSIFMRLFKVPLILFYYPGMFSDDLEHRGPQNA